MVRSRSVWLALVAWLAIGSGAWAQNAPYPNHLVRIVVTGPALAPAYKALEELRDRMREAELLGPAPLLRLRGRYRAQLIAKTDRPRAVATQAAQLLAAAAPAMRRAGLTVVVDVDPQSL